MLTAIGVKFMAFKCVLDDMGLISEHVQRVRRKREERGDNEAINDWCRRKFNKGLDQYPDAADMPAYQERLPMDYEGVQEEEEVTDTTEVEIDEQNQSQSPPPPPPSPPDTKKRDTPEYENECEDEPCARDNKRLRLSRDEECHDYDEDTEEIRTHERNLEKRHLKERLRYLLEDYAIRFGGGPHSSPIWHLLGPPQQEKLREIETLKNDIENIENL